MPCPKAPEIPTFCGYVTPPAAGVHTSFDPFRDDSRFEDLLVPMGLDDESLAWLDERDAVPTSTP